MVLYCNQCSTPIMFCTVLTVLVSGDILERGRISLIQSGGFRRVCANGNKQNLFNSTIYHIA